MPWSDRGRALALTAGVAALLLNLCVSGGIAFPSVAGPLWVAVALALNAHSLQPSRWLSRPGVAMILPLPILVAVVLGYVTSILYPVLGSDSLLRDAVRAVAFFHSEGAKPPAERVAAIRNDPDGYLRKLVLARLEQAIHLTPDDARLHVQAAFWYGTVWRLNLQKTQVSDLKIARQAVEHGVMATRFDPEGGQGYMVQYQLRMMFGGLNEAMAKLPDRDPLFVNEKEQTAKQQYELAGRVLEGFLPNDPTEAKLHYSLALAWAKAGDRRRCREQAEEARRLDEIATAPTRKLTDPQRKQVRDWLDSSSAS